MRTLVITEKSSQARDLRAAIGERFGKILPAEGHLLRLAEPHEVEPSWKSWSCVLLKPDGLYPTKAAADGNKPVKLRAIAAALQECDEVILATDCDREGQLIGDEILEHLRYRGRVRRALFTAQDPKSLRQAFDKLKPNRELRPLYEAAVARQQADQIFNLSLTRTATRTLLARGTKGVIGIGRVKTPTLAIVCLRELEIRNFKVEDYYEIVATAKPEGGDGATFQVRHAPPVKDRIRDKAVADMIARAAAAYSGPMKVTVENRRQAPPRLYDLPSLQKTCGQRWGWNADKTLEIAQALYDGSGKQLITYPRAEARHLAENQIADVPAITGALTRLRGFAHLQIDKPIIRRGKSGHFCDKSLEGVSHHAIVPNVNVMDDLESRIARLSDDEKRLFALVCRSYLAMVMPDYEYRQTVVSMKVPVPERAPGSIAEFKAVGRMPLVEGWKAAFGSAEAETPDKSKDVPETEQALPPLIDGQHAKLSKPRVQAKKTQPPPRYNEGTLIDAMQNAWRFVEDDGLRDRLKEAKGIGTPATRAEILKGLKRQSLLAAQGKLIVPTDAGLALFELLRGAAPALVDPGTTAVWEMRLDDIVAGKADFRAVIDEISAEAGRLITALTRQPAGTVAIEPAQSRRARSGHTSRRTQDDRTAAKPRTRRRRTDARTANDSDIAESARTKAASGKRRRTDTDSNTDTKPSGRRVSSPTPPSMPAPKPGAAPPTERMLAFARKLAGERKIALPEGIDGDFRICRAFLDEHTRRAS